jgi:hypothetical protein
VTLPTSNVAIDVNVVWQKPSGATGWLCGAAVPEQSTATWRQLVDAVLSVGVRAPDFIVRGLSLAPAASAFADADASRAFRTAALISLTRARRSGQNDSSP